MLTSGRALPGEGGSFQRGEGVAIVLLDWAVEAWKSGERQWKAWSPRIVTASLEVEKKKLHIVSCYAPTRAASRQDKENFYDDLGAVLAGIPDTDMYVLLGDFNAHIGSRESAHDQWSGARGPHGHGAVNDAGQELLSFLASHQATACNTWYEKRDIHLTTWQHPKSKSWSCIDYIVMRQKDRKLCVDVAVRRGAECNTDHQFLCAELRRTWKWSTRQPRKETRRFEVSGLTRVGDGEGGDAVSSLRQEYVQAVLERADRQWPEDGTAEDKWSVVRSALVDSAEETLGRARRRQPDWFVKSEDTIRPYLQMRNAAYTRWLASNNQCDLAEFREARGRARAAVRRSKSDWFRRVAAKVERERFGGKEVWQCIRDLQRGRRGRMPVRVVTVEDEDGRPCVTTSSQQERWRRHFSKVLNVQSQFTVAEIEKVRQRPCNVELAESPTKAELASALKKLKNGKAPGSSSILPEMVKAGR